MIHDILFYVFVTLTLICGALVIANPFSRNRVTSARFRHGFHEFTRTDFSFVPISEIRVPTFALIRVHSRF